MPAPFTFLEMLCSGTPCVSAWKNGRSFTQKKREASGRAPDSSPPLPRSSSFEMIQGACTCGPCSIPRHLIFDPWCLEGWNECSEAPGLQQWKRGCRAQSGGLLCLRVNKQQAQKEHPFVKWKSCSPPPPPPPETSISLNQATPPPPAAGDPLPLLQMVQKLLGPSLCFFK